MKTILIKLSFLLFSFLLTSKPTAQEFQGKAYYMSKTKMELGNWGSRLSEGQKKEVEARLKNRLEKTYVLTFNKEESNFEEDEKLDAISGATDSWGKNFSPGKQYKNVKTNSQLQSQEFYGKYFLVTDNLQPIEWKMGAETKQIGKYLCFKASALIPTLELTWYDFSWNRLRSNAINNSDEVSKETAPIEMTEVEAWYTPQIPVSHGPLDYWGLPGLILEVSAGNSTMLCSKIIMNPEEKSKIDAPEKGKVVTKKEYQEIITTKMIEFRDNRGSSGRG